MVDTNEYMPDGEAACEPGGNYGLCRTHPTCVMVQDMLAAIKRSIGKLADSGIESVVLHDGSTISPRRNIVDGEALSEVLAFADLNTRG